MPPINGQTASFTRNEERARDAGGHPAVIVAGKLKANDGVYPTGLILKRDADGLTFIPAATGEAFAGVLDQEVDTGVDPGGLVVIHGGVKKILVKIGADDPAAPSQADILALQVKGIFPQ